MSPDILKVPVLEIEPNILEIEELRVPELEILPPTEPLSVVLPEVETAKPEPVILPFKITLFKLIVAELLVTDAIVELPPIVTLLRLRATASVPSSKPDLELRLIYSAEPPSTP